MAQGNWQSATAEAGDVAAADITDATATGIALVTAADAAAGQTALSLVPGTNVQVHSAKLAALAAIGSSTVLIRNTGAGSVDGVALGVAAGTSVPTRADADLRYPRVYTSMPATDVAQAGWRGYLIASGYPCVAIAANGSGEWSAVDDSITFAEMLALGSPAAGWQVNVSTIDLGGDAGVTTLNAPFAYDGTRWKPRYPISLISTVADTTTITNSQTAFQSSFSIVPPVGLFYPGCNLDGNIRTKTTLNGTPTHSPQIFAAAALLVQSGGNVGDHSHYRTNMWCRTANTLSANGGGAGMDITTSATGVVTMASAFDGSRTLQYGATFSGTGSDTSMVYEHIHLVMYP
jgi:hypothetical protein